jgi:hypothetical protein
MQGEREREEERLNSREKSTAIQGIPEDTGYLRIQENKLKACSIVEETLYTSIRSRRESL